MIDIKRHTLSNGLRIVHNYDATTQMVALNLLYDVGSRDEIIGKTGFAHLFEHLMFGGSANIPNFDTELQAAGGESNAWTSDDITNFYELIPRHNIETAFWLEADRMNELAFTKTNLETQKSVVIEEFKQRCLNQPYGDMEHIIRKNAYYTHPYRWPVIGNHIDEIKAVEMSSVKDFFYSHYAPNNAILCIVGNISFEETIFLAEKWFGSISSRNIQSRELPVEPKQLTSKLIIENNSQVPHNIIYKAFRMCDRHSQDYQCTDLISDVLSNGTSSRLYQNLLMKGDIFSQIDASIWGSIDPGLFTIKGTILPTVTFEEAESAINTELNRFISDSPASKYEIEKCVNKYESKELFGNLNQLERASNLAYHELLDNACNINTEIDKYRDITTSQMSEIAKKLFDKDNCTTLYYGYM